MNEFAAMKRDVFTHRTIYLDVEINQEISNVITDLIKALVKYDKYRGTPKDKLTLTFEVNSPGGSVPHGMLIYKSLVDLKKLGYHVTTRTTSYTASMGSVILCAGNDREISEFGEVLVHCPLSGNAKDYETLPETTNKLEMMERCWTNMCVGYKSVGVPEKILREIRNSNLDKMYSAEQCLKLGIATEII